MSITITYIDAKSFDHKAQDISDIVESISISTAISGAAGKCDMSIIGDGADFNFGSECRVFADGNVVFVGFLFSVSMSDTSRFSAVFYDQTRYLRNSDCMVYKKLTASDLFGTICGTAGLRMGTVDESSYVLPATVSEGKSYWDMLTEAIDMTAAYEKKLYIVRDYCGELEFRNIENLRTDFVIDDEGIAMGFNYTIGIDQNSFNQVKLGIQSGSEMKYGIKYNQEVMDEWGFLQYYQTLRERISEADMERRAEQQLAMLCRPTRELSLDCFGDWRISAGCGVGVNISSVMAFRGMHNFYVSSCTHTVSHDFHKMSLTLAINNFGR